MGFTKDSLDNRHRQWKCAYKEERNKVPFRIKAANFLPLTQILIRLLYNVFRIAIGPAIILFNISTNEWGGFKSTTIGVTLSTS